MEERFDVADILVSKTLNKPLDDYKVANPMVRIARDMEARGLDVAQGAKIHYVIVDAYASPQVVQTVEEYDPDSNAMDRMAPPTRSSSSPVDHTGILSRHSHARHPRETLPSSQTRHGHALPTALHHVPLRAS